MSESKDPAIKLFGRTIPCAAAVAAAPVNGGSSSDTVGGNGAQIQNPNQNQDRICCGDSAPKDEKNSDLEHEVADEDTCEGLQVETKQDDSASTMASEEGGNPDAASGINEDSEIPPADNESAPVNDSKPDEDHCEASTSQEKTLKKPDKILPCPRCNSMDTKFCYYNNYNVNQPRHFCRNCQRYWTAGGTMRNVPVGAGRRKNKNSTSHYRQVTVTESLQNAQNNLPNGVHHPSAKSNGTVLTFGSDTPLCESMASALNLAEKSMRNCAQNGFYRPEELRITVACVGEKDSSTNTNGSSVTASSSKDEKSKTGLQEPVMQNCKGFPPSIACFPAAPWPYPYNSAQWAPQPTAPAFYPPSFPVPFYPAPAYWGSPVPGAWNVPWIPQPSSANPTVISSSPNSPTLGKHSRDESASKANDPGGEEPNKESDTGRCLWIPKTLRIDDPEEAAKSSIWTTLGIKNHTSDLTTGKGVFKAFQSKGDEKHNVSETASVLQANPAALSRSHNFHESS